MNNICSLSAADFEIFYKTLDMIFGSLDDGTIRIKQNKVLNFVSSTWIYTDLSRVITTQVDLDIINPQKYIGLLKKVFGKNKNDVSIFDSGKSYIIKNSEIELCLPKAEDSEGPLNIQLPDFSKCQLISTIEFEKDEISIIKALLGKSINYINIIIKDNNICGLSFYENSQTIGTYITKNFRTGNTIKEENADLVLRSDKFLAINADYYKINIVLLNEKYFMITETTVGGKSDIKIIEKCENVTGVSLDMFH